MTGHYSVTGMGGHAAEGEALARGDKVIKRLWKFAEDTVRYAGNIGDDYLADQARRAMQEARDA